jgi:hypothetical protein
MRPATQQNRRVREICPPTITTTLKLTPGRYAPVLNNQAYDFNVDGTIVDRGQCIERIVATNGTFYTDRRNP